jgi:3-dehydro-L-gulonate 2-dehydrogenase
MAGEQAAKSPFRVPFEELSATLGRATLHLGLEGDRAALCARLFAETTLDGVYTHGVNRFPRFAAMCRNGSVDVRATPERVSGFGAIERWEGHYGPGNLAAHAAMTRAVELARTHGLGAIALAHTSHWMRAGTYGWLAAEAGCFGVCWTNTMPNLPAWGTAEAILGNNPLVFAVPRAKGPVVLDMAMSQFSYGTLDAYRKRGEPLPVPGGYDAAGRLTTDAAAIDRTQRALPIGFWKGSGLSMMLDLFAAMLAGGLATHQIPPDTQRESGVSQFFLAIDPTQFADPAELNRIADGILDSIRRTSPLEPGQSARYPGEQTLRLREENTRLGVPVDPELWQRLLALTL